MKITLAAVLLASTIPAFAADLAVAGSSTVQPIIQQAAKVWTGASIQVGGGGSSDGIAKVKAGVIAIGMSSRALKESEVAEGLVGTAIGMDGVALVVHRDNGVANLTSAQVQEVFCGAITDWFALGGATGKIALVAANEKHATTEVAAHHFGLQFTGDATAQTMAFAPKAGTYTGVTAERVNNNKDIAARISTSPMAIAFLSIGSLEEYAAKGVPLKALNLDGVSATSTSIKDGTWPVTRPLLLVTKGAPAGSAKELIEFMLTSAGQALITSNGFTPVK